MTVTMNDLIRSCNKFNTVPYSREKAIQIVDLFKRLGYTVKAENSRLNKVYQATLYKVDYDCIVSENERWIDEVEVGIDADPSKNGVGYFIFTGDNYSVKNRCKSNAEYLTIKAEIERLQGQYDHYTEYIENYRQQQQAIRNNDRIITKINELKARL